MFQVSDSDLKSYEEDGACVLRGVIDQNWQDKLADAIERDIASPGPFYHGYDSEDGKGRFHGNLRIWQNDSCFHEFCHQSVLPGLAQQFFASQRINLLYDQLFVKEPGTTNPTRWHNDQPYWPVRGWHVMSFWMSLDPVTQDSGAMNFVRGSHKWDRWFQPEKFGKNTAGNDYEKNDDYETMPDIDANIGDYDLVTWDLEPGDVYVFHGLTVHGAGGNLRQDRRRRGYTVRYTGDDAFYDSRPGTSEPLRETGLKDGDAMTSATYPLLIS
jgi:ectoine hydroxylase-related dioxygenase (phytanoyl-CoA dioxygenase family)